MDLDDSPLLHEPDLMLAVLRVGSAKSGTLNDCVDHLQLLRKSAQIHEPLPEAEVRARLQTAIAKLHRARLIEALAPGRFRITARDDRGLWPAAELRARSPFGARGLAVQLAVAGGDRQGDRGSRGGSAASRSTRSPWNLPFCAFSPLF